MLMGAVIGAVVGLVFYFIQQQQRKKAESSQELDANMQETNASSEENEA